MSEELNDGNTEAQPILRSLNPPLPEDAYSIPLEDIDMSRPELYPAQRHWAYFERLRKEDPVHFFNSDVFGPFWSITKFEDIQYVDTHQHEFSSEPAIIMGDLEEDFAPAMFIAMDQPKHDVQRKIVTPAVAPIQLSELESVIRERVCTVLDSLPVGETFDWVDKVSIEITTQMLATLFDYPFEKRRDLTFWSDVTTDVPRAIDDDRGVNTGLTGDERQAALFECVGTFAKLLEERGAKAPTSDFISLMAHNPDMANMDPMELMGNLMLLIVGGNDTTRNSMSSGVLALNDFPGEYDKLRADTSLIPNMVSEIIRWQTPLGYMRRTATCDVELGGKQIKKGDKVVMWYVSGNRDETKIDRPNEFMIDRKNARQHLSFGFGIHRCMGNRLAEMQIRILWEEIMKRFSFVEVVGDAKRVESNFVMGIAELPVKLHAL